MNAWDEMRELGCGGRLDEILGWIHAHRGTAIGSALNQLAPMTPRLMDAQVDAMCQVLDLGYLDELTADELRYAAWDAQS